MTEANFEGHDPRECTEHRTTGRRAWCFDCSEWCYPAIPCKGCELPQLRARNAELWEQVFRREGLAMVRWRDPEPRSMAATSDALAELSDADSR